jgi:hypothetical protein
MAAFSSSLSRRGASVLSYAVNHLEPKWHA